MSTILPPKGAAQPPQPPQPQYLTFDDAAGPLAVITRVDGSRPFSDTLITRAAQSGLTSFNHVYVKVPRDRAAEFAAAPADGFHALVLVASTHKWPSTAALVDKIEPLVFSAVEPL